MNPTLREELMRLCAGRQYDYPDAVRWIQAHIAEDDEQAKPKRKRATRLRTVHGESVELDAEWVREHRERSAAV